MEHALHHRIWDHSFAERSDAEWSALFAAVVDSFSDFLEHTVSPGDVAIDDEPSAAHACIGAPITVSIVGRIGLTFCGGISISVNRCQSVSVRATLILFCNDQRLAVHPMCQTPIMDWYWFELDRDDPTSTNWLVRECPDESGEWEAFMTMKDWAVPE